MIFKRSTPLPRFKWVYGTVFLGLCFSTIVGRPDLAASSLLSAGNHHDKPYAVIFGTVWGPDDRPVYGVKVKIRRENEKKARWELYSDHNGEFAQHVPPGRQDYVIGQMPQVTNRPVANDYKAKR